MNKLWLLALLALGGCSALTDLTSASLTTTQVYIAANAFDAAEVTATQYLGLLACGGAAMVCRSPSAVAAIVPAVRAGYKARQALVSACAASTTATACVSAYTTVTTAVTTLQAAFTAYSIQKGS